jgi:hypothetical protein
MKITITTIVALCLFALTSFGQNTFSVKGVTADTSLKTKLTSTVTFLNAKDSILRAYTRSAPDGSFSASGLPAGNYLLWITSPGYATYEDSITLCGANQEHNFGTINLQDKAKLLGEVVIKGAVRAIQIKGDTTVYNARAFKIQPNDKVEDLLKQLPDVQIDKDGKITAQGQSVPKVLVDGEEFFGDDPLLVTRNLRADMVDKVEIYNKKSETAAFTGIDDGKTTKTINVKLREDKKSGVFGKAFVGVATKDLYDAQAMFNKFKGKYKLSAYGTTSTVGKNGLGGDDASRLGTSSSSGMVIIEGSGGELIVSGGDDFDNASYSGSGMPKATTAGAHFDTKWNADKESINTNYRIGSLSLNTIQGRNEQLNFANNISNTVSSQKTYNHTFRQRADMIYQNNFNVNNTLRFSLDGTVKNTDNTIDMEQATTREDGTLLNREVRSEKTGADHRTVNASLLFNKKFKKLKRTLSLNVSEAFNQVDSKRFINSVITTPAKTPADSVIRQFLPTQTISSVLNSNITYSEPITTKFSAIVNYALGMNNATSNRESYNKSANIDGFGPESQYDVFDATFSNNYKYNILTNQVGLLFNYQGDKTTLTFGTKASDVDWKQVDQFSGQTYKRSFVNWLPQATFRYKLSAAANFYLNYSGSPRQPSIDQIQPIRLNTNPLNITIGNPNLTPSFSHSFSTQYYASKSISGQYISVYGGYSFSESPIVTDNFFDPTTGKRVTQYLNFTEKSPFNYNLQGTFSRRIISSLTAQISLSTNYSKNYTYQRINNIRTLNENENRSYNANLTLNANEVKKYSFYIYGGPRYTINRYSANPTANNNAFGYSISTDGQVWLPGKFQISANLNYSYTGAAQGIAAYDTKFMNAAIHKTFLKGDNLKFSITGSNLFDQQNVNRSPNPTGISQTFTNNIGRYFMLTVTWDFTKFGTTSAPAQN